MIILSITGLIKMVLIILGVMLVLKVIGQFMIAKRNLEEEKELLKQQRISEKMAADAQKNFGKTTVSKIDNSTKNNSDYVDFEEIK